MLPTTTITKSTCCYCGVGCGIEILKHRDGKLELRGDASHPANRGQLCTKGRTLLHTVRARDSRLHFPVMRSKRDEPRLRTTWNEAILKIAGEFKRIQAAHGKDSVAFYISGQCLTEEYYLVNKITKGFLQTNNVDTNSRLCMSSAVAGYKATLGADAPPVCYDDIDLADTFFIAGANPAWCHPILFRRIEARKAADSNVKVVVVDPRKTASCMIADLHLQLKPGTDVPLLLGIARQLWRTGNFDHEFIWNHTNGYETALEAIAPWTLERTATACGVAAGDIELAASYLAGNKKFLTMWTMGFNQSAMGTDKNIAIIQLSLLTGKIGKPGCGPFSLTGQPNAMGGREVGGMANLLPAHRNMANPEHRKQVADFWNVPSVPEKPGLTAVEMFDAMREGKLKAVWIIATNPIASLPAAWAAEEALKKAELVVVQDIFPTETADFADVVLPAATWLEKCGTMTNSDRRIALLEKGVDAPGEALPDTEILLRFARAMGWEKSFDFENEADVFAEHARLTSGTDIDITALSHSALKEQGPTQWPAKIGTTSGTPRLYTDHKFQTADGKAKLHGLAFRNDSEPLDAAYPLILTTGRIRDQWHTMTRSGKVGQLRQHIDSPYCEIHPIDAAERQIRDGDIVKVTSRRGEVQVRAIVTDDIRAGVIFLPMHWGKKLGGKNAAGRANNATSPRLDPVSKEPDLKFAAVQLEAVAAPAKRILIIGGGAACLAFIEAHRRHNTRDTITVLSAEPEPIYNRVLLPHYIDGSHNFSDLVRADNEYFTTNGVRYIRNTIVQHVNTAAKTVTDEAGATYSFDALIFATGSRPAIHYDGPVPEHNVFTLRTRRDADDILETAKHAKHVVINGGGLLGIELADALSRIGKRVTVLQRSDRLMGRQLDATAGKYLAEELADRGITVLFNTSLTSMNEEGGKISLQLTSTSSFKPALTHSISDEQPLTVLSETWEPHSESFELPCDMLVFATGTVPNKELAGAAGLSCNRGIVVDGYMQTSVDDIFAIGECAEAGGQLYGTTAVATQHATALAEYLRGNFHAPFERAVSANILKVNKLSLSSAGVVDETQIEGAETVLLHDPRRRTYQKLVILHERLIGALLMGNSASFPSLLRLIESGVEISVPPAELLAPRSAASPTQGPIVCSCMQVGAETIRKAGASGCSLAEVCKETGAGTVCGSCRPEITKILRSITVTRERSTAKVAV